MKITIEIPDEEIREALKEYMKRGNVAKNQSPPRMATEELFVKLYGMNWKKK